MQLVGVSQDDAEDSRDFATRYGIAFPLLTDRDKRVARAYTGIDGADNTIPGIVIVRRDGQIVFRRISETRDDRLDSAALLAEIDRVLGRSGARARTGYQVLERVQLGIEANTSRDFDGQWGQAALARVALPLHRYAIAGLRAGYSTRTGLEATALVGLRLPILGDAAALQLTGIAGVGTDFGDAGLVVGGRFGAWAALSPMWGLELHGGVTTEATEATITVGLGISRLID